MIIKGTAVTIRYKKIENLKRTFYNHEDILEGYFVEAAVLPIPDDAPVEVPRIIVKSNNEHSQLNITPVNATLQIKFDKGYEIDWGSCKNYILNKMAIVFELLNKMTYNEYEYIGVVTEILMNDKYNNGTDLITNNLLKSNDLNAIYDMQLKYTFVENENMFVNIVLQNARLYKENVNMDVSGALSADNQVKETIGVIVDINDRYGFNNISNYHTDSKKLEALIEHLTTILESKLETLLEKGVY